MLRKERAPLPLQSIIAVSLLSAVLLCLLWIKPAADLRPVAPDAAGLLGHRLDRPSGGWSISTYTALIPPAVGLPSDAWRPQIFRECAPGMNPRWAPCQAQGKPNVLLAEEVVYPAFRMRAPRFLRVGDREAMMQDFRWYKPRYRYKDGWIYHTTYQGQSWVMCNVDYNIKLQMDYRWRIPYSCMGHNLPQNASHLWSTRKCPSSTPRRLSQESIAGKVHLMQSMGVNGNTWQHWMDRAAPMLIQADHLRPKGTRYVTMPPQPRTAEMWDVFEGIQPADMVPHTANITADTYVHACQAPSTQPYIIKRIHEKMLQGAGLDPRGVPPDQRKVIVAYLRNNTKDLTMFHGGRSWENWPECEPKMQKMLDERGKGEYLRWFNQGDFKDLKDLMRFWNTQVRAFFGVHGGGHCNYLWSSPNTTYIELWPVDFKAYRGWGNTAIQDMQRMLELDTWLLPVNSSASANWAFNASCSDVVEMLRQGLESVDNGTTPSTLEPYYQGVEWYNGIEDMEYLPS